MVVPDVSIKPVRSVYNARQLADTFTVTILNRPTIRVSFIQSANQKKETMIGNLFVLLLVICGSAYASAKEVNDNGESTGQRKGRCVRLQQ